MVNELAPTTGKGTALTVQVSPDSVTPIGVLPAMNVAPATAGLTKVISAEAVPFATLAVKEGEDPKTAVPFTFRLLMVLSIDRTVTVAWPDTPLLSLAVAFMTAVPRDTPVTTPLLFTVATAVLSELHVTVLLVAPSGCTSAARVVVPATFRVRVPDTPIELTASAPRLTVR